MQLPDGNVLVGSTYFLAMVFEEVPVGFLDMVFDEFDIFCGKS